MCQLIQGIVADRETQVPVTVGMKSCSAGAEASTCPQAKALGEHLVVGLIPDSEIQRCKGPPVMNEAERYTMVESVKWVDEVITGARRARLMSCW